METRIRDFPSCRRMHVHNNLLCNLLYSRPLYLLGTLDFTRLYIFKIRNFVIERFGNTEKNHPSTANSRESNRNLLDTNEGSLMLNLDDLK
jgi:hypothetical protein